jgi:hypothetical protein
MSYLQELQIAMPVTEKRKVLPQRWSAPKEGCLKFNVDGAQAKVSKRGAWVVVCRDEAGRFQGSSTMIIDGISDPPTLRWHGWHVGKPCPLLKILVFDEYMLVRTVLE